MVTKDASPIMTLISAGLFLYVGFIYAPVGISGNALYDGSVTAFTWGARFVGIGLLLVAGLSFTGLSVVFLVDMIVSVVAAAGCVLVGVIWLMHNDMQGVLILLFGVFNSSAAAASWRRWNASRAR